MNTEVMVGYDIAQTSYTAPINFGVFNFYKFRNVFNCLANDFDIPKDSIIN